MAAQVVTEFLVKLQDQVSDALESAESSAQNLGSTLKQLREEQGKGGSADKKRRSSLKQLATGFKVAAAAATAMGAAFATLGGFAIKTNSDLEKFRLSLVSFLVVWTKARPGSGSYLRSALGHLLALVDWLRPMPN